MAATKVADQRGGMRNTAKMTKPNSTKGMCRMEFTLLGGVEKMKAVMPSVARAIKLISHAGAEGAENSGARKRIAQPIRIGAMHNEPSQLPVHQICHSCR